MDHDHLVQLKQHPALRLLAADNAPLIISFCHHLFIETNRRGIPQRELQDRLDDYLHALREQREDDTLYPRSADAYLEEWSSAASPWLRKYYPDLAEEAEFDLTPSTERAIGWLRELGGGGFIGTESRLLGLFSQLRELVSSAEVEPQRRLAELENQRAELDAQIERLHAGQHLPLDALQVRERFFTLEESARRLIGDFRQVEQNFRDLDRATRERIAAGEEGKGVLLDEIFQQHDQIWASDQGRSFRAFWELLMSGRRQQELEQLLEGLHQLDAVRDIQPEPFLRGLKFALLEAGERVYRNNSRLSGQLRRFIDDRAYLENRRIMGLIRAIEREAIACKTTPPDSSEFATLDDLRPALDPVMTRGLFRPPSQPELDSSRPELGDADLNIDSLYQQRYIDEARLQGQIDTALLEQGRIGLRELVEHYPVSRGVAELIGYLALASRSERAVIDESELEEIEFAREDGSRHRVRLPRVVFVR